MMELLAPAGSMEALKAAVQNGANAADEIAALALVLTIDCVPEQQNNN